MRPADEEWRAIDLGDEFDAEATTRVAARQPRTVDEALDTAIELAAIDARPGGALWAALATVAAHDLESARAMEPHLDAMAILEDAGRRDELAGLGRSWGVFAAEGGDARLRADHAADGWRLSGVKPWCSLAGVLDAALVTARVDDHRQLFAVRLQQPGVASDHGAWHARGLVNIPSGAVTFTEVSALPVGGPEWYLRRPGFAWGGIGVAACWYGGAVGVARRVFDVARARPASTLVDMHLGAIDEVLIASRLALRDAAGSLAASRGDPGVIAKRVRGIVARASEEVLWRAGHALGPGPLATDGSHAQRVADLGLYIRQHHAERDQESLGRELRGGGVAPW